jgi:hypothetical protein
VQEHRAVDRATGETLLAAMLADGRAVYLPAGASASLRTAHRAAGAFVVSPRSSVAEIARAQRHDDAPPIALDAPVGAGSDGTVADLVAASTDHGFASVDVELFLERVFADAGVTAVEAGVWAARSGVRGPAAELPEIAVDLGLDGRAEARAALRRAWRKLSSVGEELRRAVA